jgi:hypothetical protein
MRIVTACYIVTFSYCNKTLHSLLQEMISYPKYPKS